MSATVHVAAVARVAIVGHATAATPTGRGWARGGEIVRCDFRATSAARPPRIPPRIRGVLAAGVD
ncbi:MAG TPA: hypothetical protein VKB36_21095, partial [Vicinamibacterales bacterium]|nr:hypothetical protein [Vicinamibacterales bacterium]